MNLEQGIREFAQYHQSAGNRICHYIGIPIITIAVLGSLAKINWNMALSDTWSVRLDLGLCILFVTFIFDIRHNMAIAIGILIAGATTYAIGSVLSLTTLLVLFLIGWAFQLIGHIYYEKNAPAFISNLRHFYLGPRWLINQLFNEYRIDGAAPK